MGADFSRVRLNPLLDYAGVELQQGRVLLDGDVNELNGILDRRLRALASDVLDRARVSSTTKNAFKISVAGGTLQIGKGRLYVDGLLAENHGAQSDDPADRVFDDLLAESQFADPIPYTAQPYLPNPPALPTTGRRLVYLDVWDREVTYLEQPDLVESAVGVDATSRIQTVWQVRVLDGDVGTATTCATPDGDIPGWSALIAPSTGRLTTGTFEVAAADDPCELPPTGGYRGLENQLFRVEIHDPGQPGLGATFKWSRENASVGSRVASFISGTELELQSLGRDDVLRFKNDDWVEITDDLREFAQLPGIMRRITVTPETRRIQFAPALPGEMLPPAFPNSDVAAARNVRVRRWDQARRIFRTDPSGTPVEVQDLDAATSTGVINVPAAGTTLLLENGVTVSFASTGATGFRAGDYWVFAARTADASVELLDRAPPRGIHHHFARLGIWDVAGGTVTDCRNPWPPDVGGHDCSCAACVTADGHNSGQFTIQAAIDQVQGAGGGRICLGPGFFLLTEPIRIVGAIALELAGNGQTVLIAPQGNIEAPVPGILVDRSFFVTLTGFGLVMAPGNRIVLAATTVIISTPGIMIQNSAAVTVERCQFYSFGNLLPQNPAVGLGGFVVQTSVRQNYVGFFMPGPDENPIIGFGTGVGHLPTIAETPNPLLLTLDLYVQDNFMQCGSSGISLDALSYHGWQVGISGNFIGPSAIVGIAVAGVGVPAPDSRVEITGNEIVVTTGVTGIGGAAGTTSGTGIICGVSAARISDNDIVPQGTTSGGGILLDAPLLPMLLDGLKIFGNRVTGVGGIGIEIRAPLASAMIKQNTIRNAGGGGIVMTRSGRTPSSAQHLSIANNHLLGLVPSSGGTIVGQLGFALGIRLDLVATAEIEDNMIRDLGMDAAGTVPPVGIMLLACSSARITGNQVTNIGPLAGAFTSSAGIVMTAPFERAEITNNVIRRSDPLAPGSGDWRALYLGAVGSFAGGFNHNVVQTAPGQVIIVGNALVAAVAEGSQLAAVRGNAMTGGTSGSFAPTGSFVEVTVAGSCIFTDNQAIFVAAGGRPLARVAAPMVAASNNILNGGTPPLQISAPENRFTVLGNVTSTVILVNNQPLAGVFGPLNVHG